MLVMILGQTRVLYTMAHDGLLPKWVGSIHPRFRTPWLVTIATGVLVAFLAAFFNISFLGELVSLGTLLAFTIVCLGVWVMRKKQPDVPRPFRTPWVPFVPIVGMIISLALMVSSDTPAKIGFFSWLIVGLIIYFSYSVRHSKVQIDERGSDRNSVTEPYMPVTLYWPVDYLWTPWRYTYVTEGDKKKRAGIPEELSAWPGDLGCVFCNMIAAADYAVEHGMDRREAERAAGIVLRAERITSA